MKRLSIIAITTLLMTLGTLSTASAGEQDKACLNAHKVLVWLYPDKTGNNQIRGCNDAVVGFAAVIMGHIQHGNSAMDWVPKPQDLAKLYAKGMTGGAPAVLKAALKYMAKRSVKKAINKLLNKKKKTYNSVKTAVRAETASCYRIIVAELANDDDAMPSCITSLGRKFK
ncbi:MAG: hypothetical protein ACE366_30990 [Bradymonadia bacterium]